MSAMTEEMKAINQASYTSQLSVAHPILFRS